MQLGIVGLPFSGKSTLFQAVTKTHLDRAAAGKGEAHLFKPKRLPIRYFPLKQLVLYLVPFPKGAPTAPEIRMDMECDLPSCRTDLRRAISY